MKRHNIENDKPFRTTIMRKPRTRKEVTKEIVNDVILLQASDSESPEEIQYTIKEKRTVR